MSRILRAMSQDGSARIFVINSTEIVNEGMRIHDTINVSAAAFGRVLTATSLMGCMLKNKTDSVTIKVKGSGEIKNILCVSDYMGNVRGYIDNPYADVPLNKYGKFDVSSAIGGGYLSVIKDIGEKEPFAGQIELVSGEIAEDITEYFARSEQIATICSLGVLVDSIPNEFGRSPCKAAGGLIVQLLPGADENVISTLEKNIEKYPSITNISSIFAEHDCEYVMDLMFKDIPYDIFDEINVKYLCTCSRERTKIALSTVGEKDLQEIIDDDKGAELCCHFCEKKYFYNTHEIKDILANVKSTSKKNSF